MIEIKAERAVALPLGVIIWWPGATTCPGRRGSRIGRQRYRLVGLGGTVHVEVKSGGSARAILPALSPAAGAGRR
jgi:hypothetical protein